jgi:DtxR family Mn-dependent transcriptional regulator
VSAATLSEPLTRSVEDYLKAIYRLSPGGTTAATSQIAHALELSPASVSGMIKRLSEQGLLEHAPYRGVQLTAEGLRQALRMVRRHRLLETYLVAFLGYSWDTVHDEAERLEHAVSDELIERMAGALGNPGFDPHGDPIPDADGSVAEPTCTPLSEIDPGETVEIRRVSAEDGELLRYLGGLDLRPGVQVQVVEREPFRGPITVVADGRQRVIGHEVAGQLLCLPVEDA